MSEIETAIDTRVHVPRVPNFLRLVSEASEGMVSIGSLDDAALARLADAWTKDLLKRAAEQRSDWAKAR